MKMTSLRELGKEGSDTERREAGKEICETVVSTFLCPTRSGSGRINYDLSSRYSFVNINRPAHFGRCDYAGNGGNRTSGISNYNSTNQTGVIYSRTGLAAASIHDGLSNTYLLGEAFMSSGYYNQPGWPSNDQGWTVGRDSDTIRHTDIARVAVPVEVTLDGAPLAGARVLFDPEPFLGPQVKPAAGTTSSGGGTVVSVAAEDLDDARFPGTACGWYKIRITSDSHEIPARYNTETTLGCEVAMNTHWTGAGGITLNLSSKPSP